MIVFVTAVLAFDIARRYESKQDVRAFESFIHLLFPALPVIDGDDIGELVNSIVGQSKHIFACVEHI